MPEIYPDSPGERNGYELILDPHDEDRINTCLQLAESVFARYESSGEAHFLVETIVLERRALSLYPKRHPDRATCCGTLAISLYTLYLRDGDANILSEVIHLQREALTLCVKGNLDRPLWCASLATSLITQYDHTGDHRLLEEAIDLQREALSLCPRGHTDRVPWCRNLATSLRLTYEHTGNQDLLAEAIELQREAISLCPIHHSDRPSCCGNLANSLTTRYARTGDDDLLTEAINLLRESLSLCPRGHSRRALWCGNLATSLSIHYECCGDDSLLAEAIELEREALSLCPVGHPNHALWCGNLASSLGIRYERTGNGQLLAEAISLEREALSLCPDSHPDRASRYGNLGSSLKMLYKKTRDARLLDEAIQLLHQAVSLSSPGHMWEYGCQLSWLHLQRFTSCHSVETSIHFLSKILATEPDSPSQAVNSVLEVLDEFWCSRSGDSSRHHIALVAVYRRTINLISLLINPALGVRPQLQKLLKCGQAGPDAFVNAVLAGYPGVGLELLEVVQGIFWSQRVYRRDPQLQDVPAKLARELEDLLRALSIQPLSRSNDESQIRTSLTTQDARHNQSTRLYTVVQEIRMLPGLERFMLGESYESLRKVAARNQVVVLVGTRSQFYALLVSPESHEQNSRCLSLNLRPDDLERACNWHSTQRSTRGSTLKEAESSETDRGMRVKQSSSATPLNRLLRYLWTQIVKPILRDLKLHPKQGTARPRLHWCPTGRFSTLPLHAAGIYEGLSLERESCADYVISCYTPTLTTLLRKQRVSTLALSRKAVSLTLIAERQSQEPHLQIIPEVEREIQSVSMVARDSNISVAHEQSGATTVAVTSAAMARANIVHLACHGLQDDADATKSGFCLGDGRLTISHLMNLHIEGGFLAFLSACETAKGSKEQPDQAMHLAAAMLFVGFKSVVATMWAISDEDGPKVARWFYEELFTQDVLDSDVVAHALDTAVGKLRMSGIPTHRWVPFIQIGV